MKKIYNIFRLNIKLFILGAASLIFPQSRSIQRGKAVLQMLKKVSHDNTFYYFEVPNGKLDLEKNNVFHTHFYFKEFFEKIFFQRKNRSDHFLNIEYRESGSKIVDKESDNLVTLTNHSLNTDF